MPTKSTAQAKTTLRRFTVRYESKKKEKLGFLVQPVVDGEDIYAIAEASQRAAAERRTKKLAQEQQQAQPQPQQPQQPPSSVPAPEVLVESVDQADTSMTDVAALVTGTVLAGAAAAAAAEVSDSNTSAQPTEKAETCPASDDSKVSLAAPADNADDTTSNTTADTAMPMDLEQNLPVPANNDNDNGKSIAAADTTNAGDRVVRPVRSAAAPLLLAPAPAPPKRRGKRGVQRLTIMPGSPILDLASQIRTWRDWCAAQYDDVSSNNNNPNANPSSCNGGEVTVMDETADGMEVDNDASAMPRAEAEEEAAASEEAAAAASEEAKTEAADPPLPHYSVFDSLDSTIDAAEEAGLFTERAMYDGPINRDSLKCALVGAIQVGDDVESIRIPSRIRRWGSYRSQVLGYKRYLASSGANQIETFGNLMGDEANYPLHITFCRRVPVPTAAPVDLTGGVRAGRKRSHPVEDFDAGPAKRRRTKGTDVSGVAATAVAAKPAPPKKDEVICLLDSTDEEEEEEEEEEKKDSMDVDEVQGKVSSASSNADDGSPECELVDDENDLNMAPETAAALSITKERARPLPIALPDPIPAFHADDFVITPYGPGKVICARVDRMPESDELLTSPILTYAIDIRSGIVHLPSSQVRSIEGSEFTETRVLTYEGVTLNRMDKLRLWPLTYLNDSLVNFYIKYLVNEKISIAGSPLSIDDFHIFPTYFYSRISYLENGGTAYRDTKKARKQLFQDLKGWTKGIDIWTKKFLIFPINYDLHWTFVLVANPGDVLRVIPPPPPPNKESAKGKVEGEAIVVEQSKVPSNDEEASAVVPSVPNPTPAFAAPHLGEMQIRKHHVPAEVTAGAQPSVGASLNTSAAPEADGMHVEGSMPDAQMNPPIDALPAAEAGFTAVYPDNHDKGPSPRSTVPPGRSTSDNACSEEETKLPVAHCAAESDADPVAAQAQEVADAAKEAQFDPSLAPCLIHFDSGKHFKLHRSAAIFKHIRKYLAACFESTKSEEFPQCSINAKTLPGFAPPIPQQDNAKDCGVYTLEMIERVLCSPPDVDAIFIEKRGNVEGSPFNNKWFGRDVIEQKRVDMFQIIVDLEVRMYEPVLI